MVQRIKTEKQEQNTNREENRVAPLSLLRREANFLCVEEMENVIRDRMAFTHTTLTDNKVSLSKQC